MFKVFIQLKGFFRENYIRYIIAAISLITASLLTLIPPKIMGEAIDHIYGVDGKVLTKEKLFFYAMSMLAIIIISYVVRFIWRYLLNGAGFKLEFEYREKLVDKLLYMGAPFYSKNLIGDLMAKATIDLNQLQASASRGILMLLEATIYLVSIIIVMGTTINLKLTVLAIIPFPTIIIVSRLLGSKLHEASLKEQNTFGKFNNQILEVIKNIKVIKAYGQGETVVQDLVEGDVEVATAALKVYRLQSLFSISFRIVFAFAYGIAIGYGSILIVNDSITQGDLIAFIAYLGMLGWPMMAVGQMINILQRGNASYERIGSVLNARGKIKEGSKEINGLKEIIFEQYNFKYPKSDRISLKLDCLRIKKGQSIGIVGMTGSGKTTLVKQLLRIYEVGEGSLKINDQEIEHYKKSSIRHLLGYVPQEHFLFSDTVINNLKIGRTDDIGDEEKLAIDAIKIADFEKDIKMLSKGLQTMVGESGVMLSGGQKQRLQIARALMKDPEILVLDDSLSAVDGKTEAKIIENLKQARAGKTNIIIAHRLSAVKDCDDIIVLSDGMIIDKGTHAELLTKDGWYAEQFRIQQMEA